MADYVFGTLEFYETENGMGIRMDTSERSCGENRSNYVELGKMCIKDMIKFQEVLGKNIENYRDKARIDVLGHKLDPKSALETYCLLMKELNALGYEI